MKNIRGFLRENYFQIVLIIFITFLVWHKILNQVFLGEGYYYFSPSNNFFSDLLPNIITKLSHRADNFARLMFDLIPPLLQDNIQAYLIVQILIMIMLYLSFYAIVSKVTKSKLIGFFASVFFLGNYIGSYELMAIGNYQRFVQRIPGLIPVLFSFYYLYIYFVNKKLKFYLISLCLFALSIFMGHFASLTLPLFLSFPIIQLLEKKIKKGQVFTRILIALSFFLTAFILTKVSDQAPSFGLIYFLTHEPELFKRTLYQIPQITLPPDLIIWTAKLFSNTIKDPYVPIVELYLLPTLAFYLIGLILVIKRAHFLVVYYLTFFISMIGTMFLYIYVDSRLNPLKYFGADRFFLISTLFASVCWGIMIKVIFNKKVRWHKILLILTLLIYVFYNTLKIWTDIDKNQYKSESFKQLISYVKSLYPKFNKKTVLVLPSYLYWPAPIFTEFGPPNIQVIGAYDGWEKDYWDQRENVYVFDYDHYRIPGKDFDSKYGEVLDLTQKYRSGEKIKFLN